MIASWTTDVWPSCTRCVWAFEKYKPGKPLELRFGPEKKFRVPAGAHTLLQQHEVCVRAHACYGVTHAARCCIHTVSCKDIKGIEHTQSRMGLPGMQISNILQ